MQPTMSNGAEAYIRVDKIIHESLKYTGERMVPDKAERNTFWEHVYRYRFATALVRHKRVLDIACGEGYGTAALLNAGAASVIGIDINKDVCKYAAQKYGINVQVASAEHIPLRDRAVDTIISFETIEHIEHPESFVAECSRILAPGGQLIISTPNRDIYSKGGKHNPFHHVELNIGEFTALLQHYFRDVELYTQKPELMPWWHVRSITASRTPWPNVRGFGRIRAILQAATCSSVWQDPTEEDRRSTVNLILSPKKALSDFFNPYEVRTYSRWIREEPHYLIAVARAG